MTNKEYLLSLPDKECSEKIAWLCWNYSISYTNSLLAIEYWLSQTTDDKGVINDR